MESKHLCKHLGNSSKRLCKGFHVFVCSQVSLTLEEKQRLAKEQEQAVKLRSQQPLAPQSVKPGTATTNTQVRTNTHTHTKKIELQ